MKIAVSRETYAEFQAQVQRYFAEVEATCQVLRAELKRRGWPDEQIDAVLREPQS